MGKLRWYKRDPVAALEGMSNLSLEERGAYNTVLDLIYARDGAVDDDPRFIAGWLRCDLRVWKRIRARLIELEKLYLVGGALRNRRADVEVDRGLQRVASVSEANRIKGIKSGAARSKNKDIDEPHREPETNTTTTTTTATKESKKVEASLRSPPAKNVSRGTRLPDDWSPDDDGIKFATEQLGTLAAARAEFAKYRDHWRAQPGSKGVKTDWPATWRNWCRKAVEMRGGRGPPRHNGQPSFHEIAQQLAEEPHETTPNRPAEDGHGAHDAELNFEHGIPAR